MSNLSTNMTTTDVGTTTTDVGMTTTDVGTTTTDVGTTTTDVSITTTDVGMTTTDVSMTTIDANIINPAKESAKSKKSRIEPMANLTSSYMKQFLFIDLSNGQIERVPVPELLYDDYIGGKGFGARILYDRLAPGIDALGSDNLLMFMTGPLTGTIAPAMRGCVVTKSPLTGIFLDSYFGGSFSPEIKYAGYDGIIITGRAEKPSWIWIDNEIVEIRSATGLWGMDSLKTNHAIKEELGDDTVKIATIGQAGENGVLFSLICCEYNRQAGRGGAGAVMGSKNLKAVAVRGTRSVKISDYQAFEKAHQKALVELEKSAEVEALRIAGTASAVEYANETGLLPNRNYKNGTFAKASDLADTGQRKHLWLGASACMGCPIRCSKMGAVRLGKYKGIVTDIVEYESAALMGSNLDISDVRAVAHLVKLCDLFGMDSMSTGGVIGFAMEACENGLLKNYSIPESVDLSFGSVKGAEYIIRSIANQDNKLGKLLAKGVKKAAQALGGNAEDFAMHTKGLETPGWGPRGASGMGLAYMTTDRGGCHQRGFPISYEVAGVPWKGKILDPLSPCDKADMVASLQNYSAGTDTLVKCDFGSFGISAATYAEMVSAATGRKISPEIITETGERIWNLVRLFNLREGIDSSKDTLPPRFVREALPDGPASGHSITEKDMLYMKQEYYRVRGWSKDGIPLHDTLKRLRIRHEQNNENESGAA
ncbi:Aldehyde ferredoxin oxidoreductase [Desulfamplus magnetovallimortis]|uniref:Aldehyde ferredoxin oxidoreductase n=1 Tax=Desulfamplus magnetovallimortis TaxID=1246637 RepID=A0A1W1HJ98_9BACT|nr:aldehyde ferredoxin oxidoreductase family protein [Desulfamplus magnetovallimortis]SLM32438.1 Aldehyde ferredoxin oxidoreductase [Desulfamplus magnetovallimortis]